MFEDEVIGQQVALRFHVEIGQRRAGAQPVFVAEPEPHGAAQAHRIAELVMPDQQDFDQRSSARRLPAIHEGRHQAYPAWRATTRIPSPDTPRATRQRQPSVCERLTNPSTKAEPEPLSLARLSDRQFG
jgi:hypothetical protein